MPAANDVIAVQGLTKSFGSVAALTDVSFRVEAGSVFGLLGRNGTGKTTLIRLLLGLLEPDAGSSTIFGEDSRRLSLACRQRIGYLSEEPFPYDNLPIPGLLQFMAAFFPHWDWNHVQRIADRFALPTDRPLRALSAGQRRKAELMLVLAQKPDLLILDDPAQGLDVTVRREFLMAALELVREEGRAVLFTSHILTDVERVVDTVAILRNGRVRAFERLDLLQSRVKRLIFLGENGAALVVPGELTRRRERRHLVVTTEAYSEAMAADLRGRRSELEVEDLNLEEIFCVLLPEETLTPPEEVKS